MENNSGLPLVFIEAPGQWRQNISPLSLEHNRVINFIKISTAFSMNIKTNKVPLVPPKKDLLKDFLLCTCWKC